MLAPCLDHLPPGVVNILAGAGPVGQAITNDERVGVWPSPARWRPANLRAAACAERVARVNLEMGGKDPFSSARTWPAIGVAAAAGLGGLPELRPGVHVRRALLRGPRGLRRLRIRLRRPHPHPAPRRSPRPLHRPGPDGLRAPAGQGRGAGRRPSRRRLSSWAGTGATPSAATTSLPPSSPALPRRPTCCARRPSARSRRSCRSRRSTKPSPWPTRHASAWGANVYTRDLETAVRCLREIRAGTVWINDPLTDNDAGPFGGMKQSGFGRELGQEGLEAFQETKHVHIETRIGPKEWWYPYGGGGRRTRPRRAQRQHPRPLRQQDLDHDHVPPLAVEAAVAMVRSHLPPATTTDQRDAGGVLPEELAGELPVAQPRRVRAAG